MKLQLKNRLEYLIKHNAAVQLLYRSVVGATFRLLGKIIKTNNNLVLFSSFGGRAYNDSPRALYESMLSDERFKGCEYVWAFVDPQQHDVPGARMVKCDTWEYFKTAFQARAWIASTGMERGLHFKKKQTYYINTWHGSPLKTIGNACGGRKDFDFSTVDYMTSQSRFEKEIFERDLLCKNEAIHIVGLPRNDCLFSISPNQVSELRQRFSIPDGKKVILYAPTWRESDNQGESYEFAAPINLDVWAQALSDEFVLLFKAHFFTTHWSFSSDGFARDVSACKDINDLLKITDVLVTDYSSTVFEAAICNIPFVCFGFDYSEYKKDRGLYFNLEELMPGGVLRTEDEVIEQIQAVVQGQYQKEYAQFRERFVEAGGNATSCVLDTLASELGRSGE